MKPTGEFSEITLARGRRLAKPFCQASYLHVCLSMYKRALVSEAGRVAIENEVFELENIVLMSSGWLLSNGIY